MKANIRLGLLALVALIYSADSNAQRACYTMENLAQLEQTDPGLKTRMQQIEQFTQNYVSANTHNQRDGQIVTIPVVVHVIYKYSSQNISTSQIQSQIDVLNEDFRRLNADTVNTPAMFLGVAADAQVEFCLASVDPNGNPTSGITRTQVNKKFFNVNDDMKFASTGGHDAWPTGSYLNIWVCDLTSTYLGYAQFPGGPANTDGVVVDFIGFGTSGTASAPYDLGRTTTHEVGHWLNLRHIWGDGPCGYDDFVADTPESDAYNYGCPIGHVSCGSVDMVQNFMDYTDDACVNIFTQGQSTRMQALFAPGGFRESLLYSNGCGGAVNPPPPPPTTCDVPANTTTSGVTASQATLNWDAVNGASSYNVRARATGSSTWATGSTASTSINFTGLTSCTDYEWQVESVCTDGSSGFSASANFTSDGCASGPCETPTGIVVSDIFKKKATLSWNAVSGAVSYDVRYREAGSSSWATKSSTTTSVSLTPLNIGSTYEYEVRTNCAGGASDWSATGTFVAGGNNRTGNFGSEATIYPNPVKDQLSVEMGEVTEVTLRLFDGNGRMVSHFNGMSGSGEAVMLNTVDLPNGIYYLSIETESKVDVRRVVILK